MQRFCDNFDPSSFNHLEDPLDNPLDLFILAKTHPHPIALEQGIRSYGIGPFLSLPTLKACEFKPTIDMPLLRNTRFLKTLSYFNIEITFSSAYETAVGLAAIGYLAHQISPHSYHGLDTLSIFESNFSLNPIEITSTHLVIKNCTTNYYTGIE